MTGRWKDEVARRPLLVALGAVVAAGGIGGLAYELSHRHSESGPYTDLLSQLGDPDQAALVGRAVIMEDRAFDAGKVAARLRGATALAPLAGVLAGDAVQGRVVETQGWVLPQGLAALCALAAKGA